MYAKISFVKFLQNIVRVMLLSGLFFGGLGWFVAGGAGLIYMATVGAILCGAGCLAMQISVIFEVRSWQYTVTHEGAKDAQVRPWFIKNKLQAKPSTP